MYFPCIESRETAMAISAMDEDARRLGDQIYEIVPFSYDYFMTKVSIVLRQKRVEVTTMMLQTLMEGITPANWKKVSVRNMQEQSRHEFDVGEDVVKLLNRFKNERNGTAMMGGLVCSIKFAFHKWDSFALYYRDEAKDIMMADTGSTNCSEVNTGVCAMSNKGKYEGSDKVARLSDLWQNISSSLVDLLPTTI